MKTLNIKIITSNHNNFYVGHAQTNTGKVIASIIPRQSPHVLTKLLETILLKRVQRKHIRINIIKDYDNKNKVNHIIYKIFNGEKQAWLESLKIPLDFSLVTLAEKKVLLAVRKIPQGKVASYGKIAFLVGLPGAARFVGTVMAKNPFAPLIPCHRVVRSDKKLGNYGLGSALKMKLLEKEGVIFDCPDKNSDDFFGCIVSEKSFI